MLQRCPDAPEVLLAPAFVATLPAHSREVAPIRHFDDFEKTHVWAVPRYRTDYGQFCSRLEEPGRYSDAAELRDAVRFANILASPAVIAYRSTATTHGS